MIVINNILMKHLSRPDAYNIRMGMNINILQHYAAVSEHHDETVKSNIDELCNSNQCMHTYTFNNQTCINNRYSEYRHNSKNIWIGSRVSWMFILIYVMLRNMLVVNATDPLCDIIAATNIQSISGYSQWSCTTAGVTSTAPCTSPLWNGIACTGNSIIVVSISNNGLTGKFDLHRHEHK